MVTDAPNMDVNKYLTVQFQTVTRFKTEVYHTKDIMNADCFYYFLIIELI